MSALSLLTCMLVLFGAMFMAVSFFRGRAIKGRVPPELQHRWRIMVILILFFLAGYVFLMVLLVRRPDLPTEMVTGPVFFGGAVFVYVVMNLVRDTVVRILSTEEELRQLNLSLEQRVTARTLELRQSHEFLKTVLDSLNEGVCVIDAENFTIVGANAAFLSEYGLTEEALSGKTCHEITHGRHDVCSPPDDLCPLLESVSSGRYASAEHVHYDKNGKSIYAEVSTSPIRDHNGRITGVVHISRDITERKAAEKALQESEEQLRSILDSIHAGIMIIDPRSHRIVDINAFAAKLIGAPREDVVGQVCHQFICPAAEGQCPITDNHETVDNSERILVKADRTRIPLLKSVIPVRYHGEEHLMESFIDISHLKKVEGELQRTVQAMKESEERYRRLVELSPDGIAIQVDGKFIFMNPAGMELLGMKDAGQVIGKPATAILHPDRRAVTAPEQDRTLVQGAGSGPWVEEKFIRADGMDIDVEAAGVPFSHEGKPAIQTIFRDITERKLIEERLRYLALYDELTGLPNRALFFDRVNQLLETAKRHHHVLAILFIDLDRFKVVNDTLGHEMGDLLLKEVSRRLTSCTRKADTVARVGGDEFVSICGKIENPDDAFVVAQKINDALSEPFLLRDHVCVIGASIGISLYPEDGSDRETLLKKADAAMYRVKATGKSGYLLYRDMDKSLPA